MRALTAALLAALAAGAARAEMDPESRRLIQFGAAAPLTPAPFGGYAFYYYNEPGVLAEKDALRVAAAPVFVDAAYDRAVNPRAAAGIGLAGGAFAFGRSELRRGEFMRGESFDGHGVQPSANLSARLNPGRMIPLTAVARLSLRYAAFKRSAGTLSSFALPPDHAELIGRIGLRLGGREPLLHPDKAGELSLWYQSHHRTESGPFGLSDDRRLLPETRLLWLRSLLIYRTDAGPRYSGQVGGGVSRHADRLSAYRLGGYLPLADEFPLNIPGYANQELAARRYALASARASAPVVRAPRLEAALFGAAALVDYLPGMGQRGAFNSGLGAGLGWESRRRAWRVDLNYGYGINAVRSAARGAHAVGLLLQYDLKAGARERAERGPAPTRSQGLEWAPRYYERLLPGSLRR